jgi:hypothetical protein
MKLNLDSLKTEIEQYLEESGLSIFYGFSRTLESTSAVYWDCDQYPDYKKFVQAARTAGARIIVLHQRTFISAQIDDALEQLAACSLPSEEFRDFERRLRDMRGYDGFVCAIELSFDHEGRAFLFDLRTEWYDELMEILNEIQALATELDDDESLGGYFSKN